MAMILSILTSETPAFDDRPGPLKPGPPGIVGAGAEAGARGPPNRGAAGAVRGLLTALLFTEPTVAAGTAPPLICESV